MTIESNKVSLGLDGNYTGDTEMWIADDLQLTFKDPTAGTKTLSQLVSELPAHDIDDHGGMAGDFAAQYYNEARLQAFLSTAANGNAVAISGDTAGHATVGAHVADEAIHQRVPKFVLRVAKDGAQYQTITAALAAIPVAGDDAPGPDQWWLVEVAPGLYEEEVRIDKGWVMLQGAGQDVTCIQFEGDATHWPLYVSASSVVVSDLRVSQLNPGTGENIAVLIGPISGTPEALDVHIKRCQIVSSGDKALHISTGGNAKITDVQVGTSTGRAVAIYCPATIRGGYVSGEFSGAAVLVQVESLSPVVRFHEVELFSSMTLLEIVNSKVSVEGCTGSSLAGFIPAVVVAGTGNTGSVVYWDGLYLDSSFVVGAIPDVTVVPLRNGDIYATRDVVYDWSEVGVAGEKHTFTGGNSGDWNSGTFEGTDFHFFRNLQIGDDSAAVGDVVAIGDSTNTGGDNEVNVLALYQAGGSNGAFLRWCDGIPGTGEVDLGRISSDGRVHAPGFVGSGVSLTALNATQLTSGTVPDARFPATLPAASGVNLTALNATQLTSGTVPNARFPATLPAASGVNLTALNATNLASGTVADGRLSSNVPLKNAANSFTAAQTFGAGALLRGLSVYGVQLFATGSNLTHPLAVTDTIVSVWTQGAFTAAVNLPTLAAVGSDKRIVFFYNITLNSTGLTLNTANGSEFISDSAGAVVTSITLGTGNHSLWMLVADTTARWRLFQLA